MKDKLHIRQTGLGDALALTASLFLLVGCSSKPPDCASQQAASVARTILSDEFIKAATQAFSDPLEAIEPADVARMKSEIERYGQALKVDIHDVVQNGYDGDAHKFSCSGKLTITAPTSSTFARGTDYSIQSTADGKDTFVVKVAGVDPFVDSLEHDFQSFVTANKIPYRYRQSPVRDNVAAPPAPAVAPNACIEAKLTQAHKAFDALQEDRMQEAERDNHEFRPLSPVEEEEWQDKALQEARQTCP
ncbi:MULTISPECIES: hypothetical protein [unclassified Variovorax]|uniref:hypothetical protein n=1 Tax=unclassified Variovorax TaxID=663243 RepID=UPI003F4617AA